MTQKQEYRLIYNSRFYILISSVLVSMLVIGLLRLQISSDQLFYIRAQQVFGLLAILYWFFALIISPLGYAIGKHRTGRLEFARRAIGVSAFYFAAMHGSIALWGQLGGLGQLGLLPNLSKWSLIGGLVGFTILSLMAATSLDKVVDFMTYRRWKWLHRLGYMGGLLVVLHVWSLGTHVAYIHVQILAFVLLAVLSGLELFKVTKILNRKYLHYHRIEAGALFLSAWTLVIIGVLLIPKYVPNYHTQHQNHETADAHSGAEL